MNGQARSQPILAASIGSFALGLFTTLATKSRTPGERSDDPEDQQCQGDDEDRSEGPDFWSVITHELGHWQGLGDLTAEVDPECPKTGNDATMCSFPNGIENMTRHRSTEPEEEDSIAQSNAVCELEEGTCVPFPL